MTSLSALVGASASVAATRSRLAKQAIVATLIGSLDPSERAVGISYLTGRPLQDRLGVGWAALRDIAVVPINEPVLTLADVDGALATIAEAAGPGSTLRRSESLHDLLARATVDEHAFLRRLIMRDLKQGATEGVMIEAIAQAAGVASGAVRRAAMVGGSLVAAGVTALDTGAEGLAEIHPKLFVPILPMLATTAESLTTGLETFPEPVVEAKLDGARIQVHRKGNEVRIYTRNLNDVTQRLPEVVELVRGMPIDDVILDGEVLALTPDGRPRPFQDTMSRFGRQSDPEAESAKVPLWAFFFDALMAAGEDLLDRPASARLAVLEALPEAMRMRRILTRDPGEAAAFMESVLATGHEGVMVKDLNSPYAAGRRGSAWLKVKPSHTLDLVVLAVEWGSGRRSGLLSNIHLGARADDGSFVMLGKTFKGMTDAVLKWQTERFLELETHREGHVVFARPEQVVEIAFDGIQASSRYPGGMALRFARVKGYRTDKSPEEADTIETVRAIFEKRG